MRLNRFLSDNELVSRMLLSGMRMPHVSKHRQFDIHGNHIPGKCVIAENSSIKKRMRAWRRAA